MKFDVFLSHNGKDKPAVEQLAHKLEGNGLKVWLDKWNLIPGEPWQEGLEEALEECQTYAVFLGPSGIGPWENEEMRIAIEERVKDKKRRVIPVLLPGAPDSTDLKLPRFLSRLTWVDFRAGLNDEEAFYRLECGIKGIAPKPLQKTGPAVPSADEAIPLPADLPLGSYIPFSRNELFEGRVPQLRSLADSLLNHKGVGTVINQTITGMGGIGKTQLAVEFAYRYGRYFCGVHWLNLADPSQLEAEIARCGREMRLPNFPEDQPTQVTLTLHTWKSDGLRLLILDNFEEPARTNDVLRRIGHSNLRLLITSRRTDWLATSGLKPLPLEVFTPQESLDYLKRTLTKRHDADKDLAGLAERLGHLPLALELASRYLNGHPRLSLDDYLTQSREALDHPSMHGWRADLPAPTEHDLDLQRTFVLSWNALAGGRVVAPQAPRIAKSSQRETTRTTDEIAQSGLDTSLRDYSTAQKIFLMAGYLAPNTPIPLEIFEKALEISTETCDEALAALYGMGLLKQGETDLPAVHPLLADFARGLAKEQVEILEKLADTLDALPKDANELVNDLGNVLQDLGALAGAKAVLERTIKVGEAAYGPDHPGVANYVNNLGLVLLTLGDLTGAKAASERAVKIWEANFGIEYPNVAAGVSNLGSVLKDLGDLAGARAAFERALKITEKAFGEEHPKVATNVSNLGSVLKDLGDLAGARAAFERALKITEKAFGEEHTAVASSLWWLGVIARDEGDKGIARGYFERTLEIFKKVLPPDHPNIKNVQGFLDSLDET